MDRLNPATGWHPRQSSFSRTTPHSTTTTSSSPLEPEHPHCQDNSSNSDDANSLTSFLPPGFESMEEYITTLQGFLHSCEPITDVMIVDYFTTNSWETRMPEEWRVALESPRGKLSSLDLMELVSLGKLRDFQNGQALSPEEEKDGPQDWPVSLKEFVRMVKALSINRTLDPDYAKFKDTLDIHLIPGMSPKKLHEVEILSGLMASYAKEHSIGSVIDLGAGQGYLSRVLAFQHQLCVLGVDSNTIQTCGAQTTQKRTEKLFVNKTRLRTQGEGKKSNERASTPDLHHSISTDSAGEDAEKCQAAKKIKVEAAADQSPCKKQGRVKKVKTKKQNDDGSPTPTTTIQTPHIPRSGSKATVVCPKALLYQGSSSTSRESSPATTPAAIESTQATTVVANQRNGASLGPRKQGPNKILDSSIDPKLAATPGSNFQLQHITHHITAATLPTLLKEHFPKKSSSSSPPSPNSDHALSEEGYEEGEGRWTLCGLHACGDLTSNMAKLFLESSATCLFSVGCCYHWITERFDKDGNVAISDGSHGFPLSAAFNHHKAHLGDHAKMIACQSPERWLKYQRESEDAIHGHYFRALLHKMMVERGLFPGPPVIAPVLGRMGKHRLKGFPHYLATALNRLKLPSEAITPEEAQREYEHYLERDVYRIGILWALRTMLGPLYEGMILLDRATFLHENIVGSSSSSSSPTASSSLSATLPLTDSALRKKKKGSVRLVAGFDVVESPRNMILIALKD